mmetsp:Transcript_32658/g.59213  ORF Transcript_32658/g.59213 Transcript_32658/m.59213 type:complete len:718 (-) Transcript_32658:176-2329(-)|eukprot:CAMPEP_0175052598 /NCGR_PEP_ID=MMETSP0052_2-20121109/8449_1 /TAXON_ID=51329 ORGANISM="Polytomella parva, Strain SAG 63-3" /NCGR_SAMPLE_ID=MMETSP0052_2 /ASSEMBLY_ACC=CAM_ASM_000194 /LENGTH=717 /DNA_ID=CAMNT_0016317021 /DNA_START=29 /DNA_END=2182 /DNA_ORIENTATION=-
MDDIDIIKISRNLFPDMPKGFPYEGYGIEDIILPQDKDKYGIYSDDDDEAADNIPFESGFESVLVIVNIPKISAEKFDKLKGVLTKVFNNAGPVREGGIYIPQDEANVTKGFCFVEYDSAKDANTAMEALKDFKLDKNHSFRVNKFDDLERYNRVPKEYQPKSRPDYKAPDMLASYMIDRLCRDQFVLNSMRDHSTQTQIFWNDGKRCRSESVYERKEWTQSFVQWSPRGSYLSTLHSQGIAIWGGPNFERIHRFSHKDVRLTDFSPNETYLVTFSGSSDDISRSSNVLLKVHDVATAKVLRFFEAGADNFNPAVGSFSWPVFKWAGGKDDRFFARVGRDSVSVYEAPGMGLLDKAPMKIPNVQEFDWSPTDSVMAIYTSPSEKGNQPARILLLKVPEKREVRQKALFDVHTTRMFWHPQGDYLAVLVERKSKSKKTMTMGFEIFRMREKDIPIDVFELANPKEPVVSLAWEPKGHRCAIVHGEGSKLNVSLYTMRDEKTGKPILKHITTLANRACNHVFWSPQGKNLVLGGIRSKQNTQVNGQLEFYNVDQIDTMGTAEHLMMNHVEWDPTGRYVATSVATGGAMDTGFNIWSFQGRKLYSQEFNGLTQFHWRPRQPSLLSAEKEAEIQASLKNLSQKYEKEDEALLQQADEDVLADRRRLSEEWNAFLAKRVEFRNRNLAFAKRTLGNRHTEKVYRIEKVEYEQVLDVKEEPYAP